MSDLTALQLIERVVARTGAATRPKTVDHVSAGDPTQAVNGIAVMAQATLEGLRKAADARANLVFTYDPAFWESGDNLNRLETDALFLEKRDFIRAHAMVVFNLQDHLRDSMPDRIAAGLAQALGWQAEAGNANLFKRPATTLLALAQELGAKLDAKTLRVVAQEHGAPLFDRFAIMRAWSEAGDFDLFAQAHSIGVAARVHDCLGRALSKLVIEAAHINPSELGVR